jgi:membrane protein
VKDLVAWVQRNRVTAHILRAVSRFTNRLGNQFAAGLTYFSVLAIVPILMFAFSALGWTLTVFRPEWLARVQEVIRSNLQAGPLQDQILGLLDQYLMHWQSVGWLALAVMLWAGIGWMGNLRSAIRAMTRPDFDTIEPQRFFLIELAINLAMLLGLLVLALVIFGTSVVTTRLSAEVLGWLNLDDDVIAIGLVRVLSGLVNVLGGWLLFIFIYWWLPRYRAPWRTTFIGSLIAAVVFAGLQWGASLLTAAFSANRAIQVFGPIVVVMLFLNIFAQLTLGIAAWLATANQPAIAHRYNPADLPLRDNPTTVTVPGHWADAEADRQRQEAAARAKHQASLEQNNGVSKIPGPLRGALAWVRRQGKRSAGQASSRS